MVVATKPSRDQIAKMAGNDPQLIRAIEALFNADDTQIPAEIETLRMAIEALEFAPVSPPFVTDDSGMLSPPIVPPRQRPYGMLASLATQTPAVINTAYPVQFDTAYMASGIGATLPDSKIYVNAAGVYDIQISIQFDSITSGAKLGWVWFRVNGADVPASASQVRLQGGNAELFTGLNVFLTLAAGDYVEVIYAADSTNFQLLAVAAAGIVPAIPSIILTISSHIGGE